MHLTQVIHKAAREKPTGIATVFKQRRTTNAQVIQRVARLAASLASFGVNIEDRIGILSANSDYYLEAIYAALWVGGVINPINTRWSSQEIAFSLVDCDTRVLFIDDNFLPILKDLKRLSPCLETIIYCGEHSAPEGTHDFEGLIAANEPIADRHRCDNDVAAILYTGGTTGQPKGVMLSHQAILMNALSTLAASQRPEINVEMHVAPLFHVGGLATLFQSALRQITQVILPHFEPKLVIQTIAQEQVNETFLVPTMLQMVLDCPDFANHDLSSLRNIVYGAASIDETLLKQAIQALPNTQFMQVYGMTEAAPVVTVLPAFCHTTAGQKLNKLKSAGRPTPTCEVKIVHPSTGKECAFGEFGEITVRTPSLMLRYWNKPTQTEHALRDGWLYTGDGGYLDEDGYLFVTDRLKDMIVSGGENIYSSEVENALLSHPSIQLCAVIGIPHPKWGEAVHAMIVLRDNHILTSEEAIKYCRSLIAGYKSPRSIEFRSELPLSAAGKILKSELRASYRDNAISSLETGK
ncbi:long-chain-fatty-acid--CoA ligase [Psychrobacter sanguinis]|uniref:Long-chain-fatty-acid--CoA ligase n=1 Tax=Psychrobacter sanguinis TaxID=861445 RepID=A0A844M355_9GAMM|nr:long-chain-fatty-acid--CoA ligase [Psychrobacter sanguinis]MUG33379.1 long-chain-fatty-acid--CoA ligase [Psychrobacter sanguinis]